MFNLRVIFKLLIRIFVILTKPFRKMFGDKTVEQCKIDGYDYAKQHQLKCEERLRKYLNGLSESQQQSIYQNILYFRPVPRHQSDENNPKRLEDYENDILTLKVSG